jgi:hypothetical protein
LFKTFARLHDLLEYLGISRRTFYRLKKAGEITVEAQLKDGIKSFRLYEVGASTRTQESDVLRTPHGRYFPHWIEWRENGLHCRPWSKTYKRNQTLYLQLFLKKYGSISSGNLEECLTSYPQHSTVEAQGHTGGCVIVCKVFGPERISASR